MKLTTEGELDFKTAKTKVGKCMFDDRTDLKKRLIHGPIFKKAIIIVDNSGADIVLGILPFAR